MKFEEALKSLRNGKKIKRPEWLYYLELDKYSNNNIAKRHFGEKYKLDYKISYRHLLCEDWQSADDWKITGVNEKK